MHRHEMQQTQLFIYFKNFLEFVSMWKSGCYSYGIVLGKVSCMILGIVLSYFIVYEAYFIVGEFF
jgi:hypothetical protein